MEGRRRASFGLPQEEKRGGETPFGGERLLTAKDVATFLGVAAKKVYELPIPRVELTERRLRWLESDVRAYVHKRRSGR